MSNKLQIRRGTKAALDLITLAAGELGWASDTKGLYIGDGATNKLYATEYIDWSATGAEQIHADRLSGILSGVLLADGSISLSSPWFASAAITLANNTPFKARDTGTAARYLAYIDVSDQIMYGDINLNNLYLRISQNLYFQRWDGGVRTLLQLTTLGAKLENGTEINEFSIDGTLAGNSDDAVPTEKAVKTYADGKVPKSDYNAKGKILVGTGSGTYESLTVGSNDQVLLADSAQAPGVKWNTLGGCSVKLTSDQTISTSTWTKLQFGTELWDTLGEFDNTTNYRYTASKAGVYVCSATGWLTGLNDGNSIGVIFKKNGNYFGAQVFTMPGAATGPVINLCAIMKLAINDYVEVFIFHNYGADRTAEGGSDQQNVFQIQRVA